MKKNRKKDEMIDYAKERPPGEVKAQPPGYTNKIWWGPFI